MHAHYYVDNTDFRDKNVLVVGMGNSAMDIAVESSFVARKTFISSRRGAYILPKYLFGRPLDQIGVNSMTGASRSRSAGRFLHGVVPGRRRRGDGLRAARSPTTGSARPTRRSRPTSSIGSPMVT